MAEEKIFAEGFVFKRKETAPDFVIGSLSLKLDEAVAFMRKHEKNGWVNLQVKQARTGNYYVELDTFEPKEKSSGKQGQASQPSADTDDDLPF